MRTILATLFFASAALAQTPAIPQQGPPPKNLTKQSDGHFSANRDPANPEKFELHFVIAGETLSGIAGQALNNPRLWPQLWEQNEHIINPHWIYPNDKILIKPVTQITEAAPPEAVPPPPPPPTPEPEPPALVRRAPVRPPAPAQPSAETAAPVRAGVFVLDKPQVAPEIKTSDLYCSGFVQKAAIPKDLKVISTFDPDGNVMASDSQYVYLSQGSEDGVAVGRLYQVIRPTIVVTNPKGRTRDEQNLGMHYLDIAQLRVVMTQPDFSLARIVSSCGDAVEIGDYMLPFQQIALPPLSRPRPFSATMKTSGGAPGNVVMTQAAVTNFGSILKGSGSVPGVRGGDLGSLERGIASDGNIVYIDVGDGQGVKPGDVFIVYRNVNVQSTVYDLPAEARKLRNARMAIGELVVVKVGEHAATALVTYSSDGIFQGDSVERR